MFEQILIYRKCSTSKEMVTVPDSSWKIMHQLWYWPRFKSNWNCVSRFK